VQCPLYGGSMKRDTGLLYVSLCPMVTFCIRAHTWNLSNKDTKAFLMRNLIE